LFVLFPLDGLNFLFYPTNLVSFSRIAQYLGLLVSEKVAIPVQYQPSSILLQCNMAGFVHALSGCGGFLPIIIPHKQQLF
jgi:hypothetical protein